MDDPFSHRDSLTFFPLMPGIFALMHVIAELIQNATNWLGVIIGLLILILCSYATIRMLMNKDKNM